MHLDIMSVKTINKKNSNTEGLGESGGIKIHMHKTARPRRKSL